MQIFLSPMDSVSFKEDGLNRLLRHVWESLRDIPLTSMARCPFQDFSGAPLSLEWGFCKHKGICWLSTTCWCHSERALRDDVRPHANDTTSCARKLTRGLKSERMNCRGQLACRVFPSAFFFYKLLFVFSFVFVLFCCICLFLALLFFQGRAGQGSSSAATYRQTAHNDTEKQKNKQTIENREKGGLER